MLQEGYGSRTSPVAGYREPVDDRLHIAPGTAVPMSEVTIRASRSSGPGGQHANVTASRVEAVFEIQGSSALDEEQRRRLTALHGDRVTAVAQDSRSQARNRELALERLRDKLAAGLVEPRRRRATRPSRSATEGRLEAKRRRSERKRARRPPDPDA
jgi:ribosome-associated protein